MEIFGILLSIPAAFIASSLYCFFLVKVVRRFERISRGLWWLSVCVLGLFILEALCIANWGAVESRRVVGPGFEFIHFFLFLVGTPAMANLLVLRRDTKNRSWPFSTVVVCTVFALGLVLLQYHVSEALYGVDGDNGPYSESRTVGDAIVPVAAACRVVSADPFGPQRAV